MPSAKSADNIIMLIDFAMSYGRWCLSFYYTLPYMGKTFKCHRRSGECVCGGGGDSEMRKYLIAIEGPGGMWKDFISI